MSVPRQTQRPEAEADVDERTVIQRLRAEQRESRDPAYRRLIDDAIERANGATVLKRSWKLR